jgi:hypothetical protein
MPRGSGSFILVSRGEAHDCYNDTAPTLTLPRICRRSVMAVGMFPSSVVPTGHTPIA